jgi:hypothetical protein
MRFHAPLERDMVEGLRIPTNGTGPGKAAICGRKPPPRPSVVLCLYRPGQFPNPLASTNSSCREPGSDTDPELLGSVSRSAA